MTSPHKNVGPIEMVVVQGTTFCNLNCKYCYLSEESRKANIEMPIEVLLPSFKKLFNSGYLANNVRVSWHSGEPMVLKPAYYADAIQQLEALRKRQGTTTQITFDLQTNGTLIDDDWCEFLKANQSIFTIGISCDGPATMHNRFRRSWSDKDTHHLTERGMKLLAENNIPFDITAVLSKESLYEPDLFLDYFAGYAESIREFHFNLHDELTLDTNNVEELLGYQKLYKDFLNALLMRYSEEPGSNLPAIRNFTSLYHQLSNFEDSGRATPWDLTRPLKTISIESNGDVTTFYAGLTKDESRDVLNLYGDNKGFTIGNLLEQTLDEILDSAKYKHVADDFRTNLVSCENTCEYFEFCSGGYGLTKLRRNGTFNSTETPECTIHVKTFVDTVVTHMEAFLE